METETLAFGRALTDAELEAIRSAIDGDDTQGETPSVRALVRFYTLAGADLFGDGPAISPSSYRIPSEQWQTICGWLIACNPAANGADALSRVNYGLDWMNTGPGAL